MARTVNRTAGFGTERAAEYRRVLLSTESAIIFPGGKIIDGSESRDTLNTGYLHTLRAGTLMGLNSTSSLYCPSIIGTLSTAHTSNSATSMTVSAATATEIVRRIGSSGTFYLTGPPASAGTVATGTITFSAVNTTTGVITVTATSTDYISGSWIQPTDGSATPLCLIGDCDGIKVTDENEADVDVPFVPMLVGGILDSSQILYWPTDTSLRTQIRTWLRAYGLGFVFDDQF